MKMTIPAATIANILNPIITYQNFTLSTHFCEMGSLSSTIAYFLFSNPFYEYGDTVSDVSSLYGLHFPFGLLSLDSRVTLWGRL